MSTGQIDTALIYLTDELLKQRYAEELENLQEQGRALERTKQRQERLFVAMTERGLLFQ